MPYIAALQGLLAGAGKAAATGAATTAASSAAATGAAKAAGAGALKAGAGAAQQAGSGVLAKQAAPAWSRFTDPNQMLGLSGQGGASNLGPSTMANQNATSSARAAQYDRQEKMRETMKGVRSTLDQMGSAFDRRLSGFTVPSRGAFDFQPNTNPGIAGMVQQLLLAANRR